MPRTAPLVLLLLPAIALAQSSRPAQTPFDPASPQAAVESLSAALAAGDGPKIRSLLYATTDPERRMVDAMVAMSQAIARLRPVVSKRFGDEPAKQVTGDPAARAADQHAKLESAYVQTAGDTAHVTFPDPLTDPITLRRIDGQWRVPVAAHAPNLSPEQLDQRAADLTTAAQAIDEVTTLCQGGKWHTPNDVLIAIQERILKAQQDRLPRPVTRPTSAPATRPEISK
jgi:hypothetical protein